MAALEFLSNEAAAVLARARDDMALLSTRLTDGLSGKIKLVSDNYLRTASERFRRADTDGAYTVGDLAAVFDRRPPPELRKRSIWNLPPADEMRLRPTDDGLGTTFFLSHEDNKIAVYKTISPLRESQGCLNERNAPQIASRLNLHNIIPDARQWSGLEGDQEGTLIDFVQNSGYVPENSEYFTSVEGRKVAAFDYHVAAADRHVMNAVLGANSPYKIAAIDNERIMYFMGNDLPPQISSEFVWRNRGRPLGEEVMDSIGKVDRREHYNFLRDLGYSSSQSDDAVGRLKEMQTQGKITGSSSVVPIRKPPTISEINRFIEQWQGR
ncbi:MAG: hypothetical protein J2P17_03525 [Mycobacterium sp.]|nr:hypothetical protein [Mycobacterium sp.]